MNRDEFDPPEHLTVPAEDFREAQERRDVLLHLRSVLKTQSGQEVFKYLFKHFEVTKLPDVGLTDELLRDKLGFLRAGQIVFELASEADAVIASNLLAQNERLRYAQTYKDAGIGTS